MDFEAERRDAGYVVLLTTQTCLWVRQAVKSNLDPVRRGICLLGLKRYTQIMANWKELLEVNHCGQQGRRGE
jgi:hypothetical protein